MALESMPRQMRHVQIVLQAAPHAVTHQLVDSLVVPTATHAQFASAGTSWMAPTASPFVMCLTARHVAQAWLHIGIFLLWLPTGLQLAHVQSARLVTTW